MRDEADDRRRNQGLVSIGRRVSICRQEVLHPTLFGWHPSSHCVIRIFAISCPPNGSHFQQGAYASSNLIRDTYSSFMELRNVSIERSVAQRIVTQVNAVPFPQPSVSHKRGHIAYPVLEKTQLTQAS